MESVTGWVTLSPVFELFQESPVFRFGRDRAGFATFGVVGIVTLV